MRGENQRLDPVTVVLPPDWLTPVARLMSLCLFSFFFSTSSSPGALIGQVGTGWGNFFFLPLVEHPKACGL